jgi:shikimate kinase
MTEKNIVLVGFMGSGKSVVARSLADRTGAELVAIDALIEARTGKSIGAIFKEHGEGHFRDLETEVIREVSLRRGLIIDCGGGTVLRKENLQNLKANGIVFYLEASPEVIYERIKNEKHRPLLKVPDPLGCIKEMYQQRLPLYKQADYTIDANDASIEGPVGEILQKTRTA